MDPKEPMSYSRLGPMDPRQLRYELAPELSAPTPPDGLGPRAAGGPANRRRRGRLRRRRSPGS